MHQSWVFGRKKEVSAQRGGGFHPRRRLERRGELDRRAGRQAISPITITRVAVIVAIFIAILSVAGPAAALQGRGHAFAGRFGNDAAGEVPLKDPVDVAVSEVGPDAGDVYVVDRGHNRIQQYGPGGAPLASWGWGVADGAAEYEVCKTPSTCKAGTPGSGKGLEAFRLHTAQLIAPTAVAVDNSKDQSDPSAGDVYVIADAALEHTFVYKFGPNGEFKGRLTGAREGEELERAVGVDVDPTGTVWVAWSGISGEIVRFGDEEPNHRIKNAEKEREEIETQPEPLRAGFAVDSSGHPYVDYEPDEEFVEAPESTREAEEGKGLGGEEPCERSLCIAAELRGPQHGASLDPGEALVEELDQEHTSGIAIDQATGAADFAGYVYLDNRESVAALDPRGQLVERFGLGHLGQGAGLAADAATGDVYVADVTGDAIDVFEPEPASLPEVSGTSAQDVTAQSVQLNALVNPHGEATDYQFEYGTSPCSPKPSSCSPVPEEAETLSAGFGDEPVSVAIEQGANSLLPGTTYHYRVKATNEAGEAASPEGTFRTPAEEGRYLADGRGFELVSPARKGGSAVEAITEEGGTIQASADGEAISYVADSPIGEAEGNRSFEPTQIFSVRGSEAWSSSDIITPNEHGNGLQIGKPPEYQAFSTDLSLALVQPFIGGGPLAEPPLSPVLTSAEATRGQEKTVYLRANAPVRPAALSEGASQAERERSEEQNSIYTQARANGETMSNAGYVPLVTALNTTPLGEPPALPPFGGHLAFVGATPDLTHVVLESEVALAPGAAAKGNLYEWSGGQLALINVLPGSEQTAIPNARLGYKNGIVRNAISSDGGRVVWSASNHLYMRDLERGITIQLDAAGPGGSTNRPGTRDNPVFQGASSDGSRVFFTDERPLLAGSGAKVGAADLFACEITEENNATSCRLTDLTPAGLEPHAGVQGLILGSGDDGRSVYFVADAVLTSQAHEAGARPGRCEPFENQRSRPAGSTSTCNLYRDQLTAGPTGPAWESPRFIAQLSSSDSPDWEPPVDLSNLNGLTSRATPDGRFLAFMSDRSLTGYDNEDATSLHSGERIDEEVFLYDAKSESLTCVSCDPSNARPHGIFDPRKGEDAGEEGLGLLVDRPKTWEGHWLAASIPGWTTLDHVVSLYQSNYLTPSGRLYFNSPADLVPEAGNGKEDVYEYEPETVPAGNHRCVTASTTYVGSARGCVGLISSGISTHESAFLDASLTGGEQADGTKGGEGGSDVFFLTEAKLSNQDTDEAFDVYDAHECTSGSPCLVSPEIKPPATCESTTSCRPGEFAPPTSAGAPDSSHVGASENLSGQTGVLPTKNTKPASRPTPIQKLKEALAACRKLKPHATRRRCEIRARRAYAATKLASVRKVCRSIGDKRRRTSCYKRAAKQYTKALRLATGARARPEVRA